MIFAFCGYPGAGKSTLVQRFAELHGVLGIDTDRFMTQEERDAVVVGRYTQAMRLANIRRYCAYLCRTLPLGGDAALADGLPNNAARRFLLDQFAPSEVLLVLVQVERGLWERRLAARGSNLVAVGRAEADAYVRSAWEPVEPALAHVVLENGEDWAVVDARLRELYAGARARG